MPIPRQQLTIADPGLGLTDPAQMVPLFFGPSSTGTANVLKTFSSINDLVAYHGQGPMVEAAAFCLANAGGPVRTMKSAVSTAGSNSAVAKTAIGTSTGTVTVAGTANDDYRVRVEIVSTGTVAVGTFRYSLDRRTLDSGDVTGYTYSQALTIPSGGTYAIANTGLTLTFVPGGGAVFFEAGDYHTFDTTAAMFNATDLSAAVTALTASTTTWRYMVLCGQFQTASAAATVFAALATHMTTFENAFRYVRSMQPAGLDGTANALTSFASQTSKRILVAYGNMDAASAKPLPGFAMPLRPVVNEFARRAAGPATDGWGFPSTDLKRVNGGPVPGVASKSDGSPAILHDEFKTEVMDAGRISTLRTYPTLGGAYVTNGRLKSVAGSDFEYWQHGILMDLACETVFAQQARWIGEGLRTNADGTIDEREAARIEKEVNSALAAILTQPIRAGGQQGHVSEVRYTVSRTNILLTTKTLVSEVAIRPLGYVDFITTTLGYRAAVVAAAA